MRPILLALLLVVAVAAQPDVVLRGYYFPLSSGANFVSPGSITQGTALQLRLEENGGPLMVCSTTTPCQWNMTFVTPTGTSNFSVATSALPNVASVDYTFREVGVVTIFGKGTWGNVTSRASNTISVTVYPLPYGNLTISTSAVSVCDIFSVNMTFGGQSATDGGSLPVLFSLYQQIEGQSPSLVYLALSSATIKMAQLAITSDDIFPHQRANVQLAMTIRNSQGGLSSMIWAPMNMTVFVELLGTLQSNASVMTVNHPLEFGLADTCGGTAPFVYTYYLIPASGAARLVATFTNDTLDLVAAFALSNSDYDAAADAFGNVSLGLNVTEASGYTQAFAPIVLELRPQPRVIVTMASGAVSLPAPIRISGSVALGTLPLVYLITLRRTGGSILATQTVTGGRTLNTSFVLDRSALSAENAVYFDVIVTDALGVASDVLRSNTTSVFPAPAGVGSVNATIVSRGESILATVATSGGVSDTCTVRLWMVDCQAVQSAPIDLPCAAPSVSTVVSGFCDGVNVVEFVVLDPIGGGSSATTVAGVVRVVAPTTSSTTASPVTATSTGATTSSTDGGASTTLSSSTSGTTDSTVGSGSATTLPTSSSISTTTTTTPSSSSPSSPSASSNPTTSDPITSSPTTPILTTTTSPAGTTAHATSSSATGASGDTGSYGAIYNGGVGAASAPAAVLDTTESTAVALLAAATALSTLYYCIAAHNQYLLAKQRRKGMH